ncbi:restriction endonuclease subunit S [Mameliella sp. LZ-28]|uniref:restriction endonuclease subunit S n=1 Tax=Mameliella sp. LZ-28 TaxID=2484146 RepID=UPI0022B7D75A|nr:restriction endonuclease subunit S [Mameliella alba]MCR9276183.1 restriction endonuclease subunit S [Paracoccaceae bacterium]
MCRLQEVTTKIGSGATPKGGRDSYKAEGLSLIRSLNVHDLDFRYEQLAKIDDEQAAALSNVEVQPDDVLLNITGASIARCCVVPNEVLPARVNQHVSIIRPIPEVLNSRFLALLLVSGDMKDKLLGIGDKAGATRQALTKAQLQDFSISLPPLEEQRRIVAVLDEAFEGLASARAHAEVNLHNARELFDTLVDEVFVDDDITPTPLAGLVSDDCTLSYGIVQPGGDVEHGLPIVRPTDFGPREIFLEGLKRIDPAKAAGYARTELQGGELLLCVRGTTGSIGLASEELAGANVTRGIVPVRFDPRKILPGFGYFQFRSRFVQEQIAAGTYGAALMQINIRDLRKLQLYAPPVDRQEKALARLRQTEELCLQLELAQSANLQDLDDLRQSLLQKAFAGELT